MRGATNFTPQLHQILRLPRKMNLMIDPRHIWNVIYNARSKHSQLPTSPNTAPATKSVSSTFQRKLRELLPPIERRFDDIPTMIRPWNRHLAPAASETLLVPSWRRILYGKIQHFALRLSPKIARNAAPATKSHTPTSPNTTPATQNESLGIYSLGIYSLLASILSGHLSSLGIYSLLASILSRHLFSLGIYSLLASILSRHLFSLGIYSL